MKRITLLFSLYTICLLLIFPRNVFSQSEPNNPITYDTTITEKANGEGPLTWQVRITRQQNDTTRRPAFFSMPGATEVGTDTSNLTKYGPHYWLKNGWNGGVKLGNGTHYPILITIEAPAQNQRPWHLKAVMDILLSTYPIKKGSVHVAGLSQGSYEWGELISYAAYSGDETAMSQIKSWVNLEGVGPGDNFSGFNQPYPTVFGIWATKYGGRMFGLEGVQDSRNIWQISQAMNTAVPNSAYFSYENFGGGIHCCWDSMYDPSVTNWRCIAPVTNPKLVPSTNPASTMGNYYYDPVNGSNIFQWMLRQGDTTLVGSGNQAPTVSAGNNQTITLPVNSVTLNGTATANGGATITSVVWSTTSGPNAPSIVTSNGGLTAAVSGLVQGTYIFTLTATDNNSLSGSSQVTVTVNPAPAAGSRVFIAPGEYQVFFIDSTKKLYGVGTNLGTLGVNNTGVPGTTLAVQMPAGLPIQFAAGGLHGGAAIDSGGNVWTWGANDMGQIGNGTTSAGAAVPYKITQDSSGNPFTGVRSMLYYYSGNASEGWYAIKNDSSLWVWGQTLGGMRGNGSAGLTAQTRPVQVPIPGGRKVMSVAAGNILIVLCSDSTVWVCGGSNTLASNLGYAASGNSYLSLQQLTTLSGIAQVAGGGGYSYALKSNGTLYGWGYYGYYMGGTGGNNTPIPTPTDLTSRLNLPKPIRSIGVSMVCTHVILSDSTLWAWGDNAQGNIGIGSELNYANTNPPYAWDYYPADLLVQSPVQVTNRHDWVGIYTAVPFVMYEFAQTADGTIYSWGRNKGGVLANGIVGCTSDIIATYPNSWDITTPTVVNPLHITSVTKVTCPYCLTHQTTSPCNQCTTGSAVAPGLRSASGLQADFGTSAEKGFRIYPTLVRDNEELHLALSSSTTGSVEVRVFDLNGKQVQILHAEKHGDLFQQSLYPGTLPAGMYILQVMVGNTELHTGKFVRQ